MPNATYLTSAQKRWFDVAVAVTGLTILSWLIALALLVATADTRCSGLFRQRRVGRNGRHFVVFKVRTMRCAQTQRSSVTTSKDQRVTRIGRLLRRSKVDELPQLINVLNGTMSLVGPRPDVPGFADRLTGADRSLLSARPGITGAGSIAFRDEQQLLGSDPERAKRVNRAYLYPAKVHLNLDYCERASFVLDLALILQTLLGWPKVVPSFGSMAEVERFLAERAETAPTPEALRTDRSGDSVSDEPAAGEPTLDGAPADEAT